MASVNQVGNTLTGVTGSGSFVGSTSPTLVTPTLGVATATSINFGGGALSNYTTTTSFTPTFTCVTPGDLSVSYSVQVAYYTRIGNLITFVIRVTCVPTFTTASGQILISGLPVTVNNSYGNFTCNASNLGTFTYPASITQLNGQCNANTTQIALYGSGSSVARSTITVANIGSGTTFSVEFSGVYFA